MNDYPNALPPLGTVRHLPKWVRQRETQTQGEGWVEAGFYLDQYRNEYTSVGHVLRCAVAKELGV